MPMPTYGEMEALLSKTFAKRSVLIATSNVGSLLARATGRKWVSYRIPEHVTFFSTRTLADALSPPLRLVRAVRAD